MPRPPPKHRELSAEERAARRAVSEQSKAGEASVHNRLLIEGMLEYAAEARQKWLRAGGYGGELTEAQAAEIRAAGFEPAPRDRPPK